MMTQKPIRQLFDEIQLTQETSLAIQQIEDWEDKSNTYIWEITTLTFDQSSRAVEKLDNIIECLSKKFKSKTENYGFRYGGPIKKVIINIPNGATITYSIWYRSSSLRAKSISKTKAIKSWNAIKNCI